MNRENPISVICLQECWTNDNTYIPLYNLYNYKLIHQGQRCCPHGGLVIYVHEQFSFMDSEIHQTTTGWEYLCIQISHNSPYSKKHMICNTYRRPGGTIEELGLFRDEFSEILESIKSQSQSAYICGDFNINLLDINTDRNCNIYFG